MSELCCYEKEVLRNLDHPRFPLDYHGAALNQALEVLRSSGYLDHNDELTVKGRLEREKINASLS